jgi:hypothetical protein
MIYNTLDEKGKVVKSKEINDTKGELNMKSRTIKTKRVSVTTITAESKELLTADLVKQYGLNPIYSHYRERIFYDGCFMGYRLYYNGGIFKALKFNKYIWNS